MGVMMAPVDGSGVAPAWMYLVAIFMAIVYLLVKANISY
jgi:hypothetical protein